MRHKAFELLETKTGEAGDGTFTALVSVFGNVDHVGDRMIHGAFKKTLSTWRKSGDPVPVILSHNWDDPMAHIGVADPRTIMETGKGLQVTGKLDIEDNPVAKQVYKLMKRRSLKEFSFGYQVPEGGEEVADDGANDVKEVELIEVGPTLKGANPATELQSIKSELGIEDKEEPKPSEDKIRRAMDEERLTKATEGVEVDLELEAEREKLAEAVAEGIDLKRQVEENEAEIARLNAPSEDELRRTTGEARLVKATEGVEATDPLAELEADFERLAEAQDALKAENERLSAELAKANAPTEEEVRRRMTNLRLESKGGKTTPESKALVDELLAEREKAEKAQADLKAAEKRAEAAEAEVDALHAPTEDELRRRSAEPNLKNPPKGEVEVEIPPEVIERTKRILEFTKDHPNFDLDALILLTKAASVSEEAQDKLTADAQRILDDGVESLSPAIEDGPNEEPSPAKSSPQDSLKQRSYDIALEMARGDLRDVELEKPEPKPEPKSRDALQRQAFELTLEQLTG